MMYFLKFFVANLMQLWFHHIAMHWSTISTLYGLSLHGMDINRVELIEAGNAVNDDDCICMCVGQDGGSAVGDIF